MDLYTNRPPTAAEDFTLETRCIELPGTRGPDGLPRVVRIRRIPAAMVHLLREPGEGEDPYAARLAECRKWAEVAVVEPHFSFNGDGPDPRWDDQPVAAQMAIAGAIAAFSTEGMLEVSAAAAAFRPGEPAGGEAGDVGRGPGGPGGDAREATPAPGAEVATASGAGV